jgi:hypothetical protein
MAAVVCVSPMADDSTENGVADNHLVQSRFLNYNKR